MSSYMVVAAATEALRRILWAEFEADPVIRSIVTAEAAIVFRNPTETLRDSANRLSIWLYQVTENIHLKNQPPIRANGPETLRQPPLVLNMSYLITPFAPDPSGEGDHILLGKSMQVLYDNSIIVLRDPVSGIFEELRIVLCNLSLEELTRIWEALRESYHLSVCYQVRVTRVDSQRVASNARIVDTNLGFGADPALIGRLA